MLIVPDEQFEHIIAEAIDGLPSKYTDNMDNVAIVYADDPTPEQRVKLKLRCNETLYGLYEGIPLPQRGMGYNLVLPDKITIFRNPLLSGSHTIEALKANVTHTVWHELAHHFGLDHDRIHALERKQAQ